MPYQQIIITGASSGLGAAFAHRLAGECSCIHLVARRKDLLQTLAEELQSVHSGLEVRLYLCDLSDSNARTQLCAAWNHLPPGSTLLINNAGLGDYGEFLTSASEKNGKMLQVNIVALTELTRALLPRMIREGGAIIQISSLAAELPIPDFAVYAATKAYVASFSEALRLETRGYGVPVLAVCPGPVHTGFGAVAQRDGFGGSAGPFRRWFYTSVPDVIEGTLQALRQKKPRYYPSLKIKIAALLLRGMPLPILRWILSFRPRQVHPLRQDS